MSFVITQISEQELRQYEEGFCVNPSDREELTEYGFGEEKQYSVYPNAAINRVLSVTYGEEVECFITTEYEDEDRELYEIRKREE